MNTKFSVIAIVAAAIGSSAAAGGFVNPVANSPVTAMTVSDWSGAYAGANINYGKGELNAIGELGDLASDGGLDRTISEPDGMSRAIRAGYDWQAGNAVFGLGAEYNIGKYKAGLSGELGDVVDAVGASADVEIKNAATVFARAGYLVNPNFLAYGLLGYTRAKGEADASFEGESESGSVTLSGATFGLGGEYKFSSDWSGYAEYAYTDFGDVRDTDGNLEADLGQIKLGVNYRF